MEPDPAQYGKARRRNQKAVHSGCGTTQESAPRIGPRTACGLGSQGGHLRARDERDDAAAENDLARRIDLERVRDSAAALPRTPPPSCGSMRWWRVWSRRR